MPIATAKHLEAARAMLYDGERNGGPGTNLRGPESCQYHTSRGEPVLRRYEVRCLAQALANAETASSGPVASSARPLEAAQLRKIADALEK